ncbi:MAG: TdeIII family type II restriction endonuclease [Pseudomonadota bacterium]
MSVLTENQKSDIENTLKKSLRNKFENYNPEAAVMPFHTALLGKDRLALYSFIHSLNTNFGTTIFEPVALQIAKPNFKNVKLKYKVGDEVCSSVQQVTNRIVDDLIAAKRISNKSSEISELRQSIIKTEIQNVKPTVVDLMLETHDNELYLFDIKTAKPNKDGFKGFKRTLLQWAAVELTKNPSIKVNSLIAIPYNPYSPKPYERWTMQGLFDLKAELKVAEEFWDFLGGNGTYQELLVCFERIGIEMRQEIDDYFLRFKTTI